MKKCLHCGYPITQADVNAGNYETCSLVSGYDSLHIGCFFAHIDHVISRINCACGVMVIDANVVKSLIAEHLRLS